MELNTRKCSFLDSHFVRRLIPKLDPKKPSADLDKLSFAENSDQAKNGQRDDTGFSNHASPPWQKLRTSWTASSTNGINFSFVSTILA
jgi:hypothetical protein